MPQLRLSSTMIPMIRTLYTAYRTEPCGEACIIVWQSIGLSCQRKSRRESTAADMWHLNRLGRAPTVIKHRPDWIASFNSPRSVIERMVSVILDLTHSMGCLFVGVVLSLSYVLPREIIAVAATLKNCGLDAMV